MTNASEYMKDHIVEKVAPNKKIIQNEKSCSKYETVANKFPSYLWKALPEVAKKKAKKKMAFNLWKALYILFPSTKQLQKNQSKRGLRLSFCGGTDKEPF